jgi:hypothetical protein
MLEKLCVCLNRSKGYDKDTFRCSFHGQLVTRECCEECYRRLHRTEREKLQEEISLNERVIEYHQKCIGDLRLQNLKLISKLDVLSVEKVENK